LFAILGLLDALFTLLFAAEVAADVGKDQNGRRSWKLAGLHLAGIAATLAISCGGVYLVLNHWSSVTHSLIWLVAGLGVFAVVMLLWIGGIILRNRSNLPKNSMPGKTLLDN
jgi:hypothetical protein